MIDKKKGFTLIELLVVIAIIALLMSILMPALGKVKSQAKDVLCRSRLSQWGIIMKLFTDDNGGFFMKHLGLTNPKNKLRPYYIGSSRAGSIIADGDPILVSSRDDELLFCPMATKTYDEGAVNPFGVYFHYEGLSSYGMNSWITKNPVASGSEENNGGFLWKTPNVKGAHYVPMFFDCAAYQNALTWHKDEPPEYDGHWVLSTNESEMRYACLNRHNEHINMVFLDFHVRPVYLKELWELHWHKNWYKGTGDTPDYNPPVWPAWMLHMKDFDTVGI